MTATFILKCLITLILGLSNVIWLLMCFFVNAMNAQGKWDHSTWLLMIIPSGINVLILWSMWE